MNKRLNKIGVMFIMLAVVVMIFSATALANVAVEDIVISKPDPTTNEIVYGTHKTATFAAMVLPSNATEKNVNWISTNQNVLKLQSGYPNPHFSAVFDVVAPGSTTIIALSNVGTNTVIDTYTVNVVDKAITGGRTVSFIQMYDGVGVTNPISSGSTLSTLTKSSVSDNTFSVNIQAQYSDGTWLSYNEIQQLITWNSTNASKIWFEGYLPVSSNTHEAQAVFSTEGISLEAAQALLYTYVYDGLSSFGVQFYRTVNPALTLTQKASVTSDGKTATYKFTQSPGFSLGGGSITKQASQFVAGDFIIQQRNNSGTISDAAAQVSSVNWNSSTKTLTFGINGTLSDTMDYRIVPKGSVSFNGRYYINANGTVQPITYTDSDFEYFEGPGTVDATTLSLTPSTSSVDFSTDSDRILYATTGKAGTFTIEAASTAAENAQFNIENTGSLPSGVTFKNVGDGKTVTVSVPSNLAAGTYYINVKAQYLDGATPSSIIIEKTFELRVGTLGTFNVSNVTLTKSNSAIPVIQTSSPVKSVNGDTIAATYKFYGGASVDRIEHTIVSLDGQFNHSVAVTDLATAQNHLASSAGYVMSYKIGDGGTGGKLDLGTYIMRVELFDGTNSLGITEVRFSVDTSFEMFDIRYSTGAGIRVEAPNVADPALQTLTYNTTTGKYQDGSGGVDRRSANQYQETVKTALGDTLFFQVAVDGFNVGDRIKFYIDDFVFGANKGGGLTAQTVEVQQTSAGYSFVKIPFTISDTTYLGTHVVQIKMAKTLDGTETFDHEINLKYDLESEYLTTEVEIYDELKNLAGKREIKIDSDLHITRTLFIPEDRILTIAEGNKLTIDPLKHVTVYGEIRMDDTALNAGGNLVVTGKVALLDTSLDPTLTARYYYYASKDASDDPHLLITDGSNVTMNGTLVDGYTNMLTGSATMKTIGLKRHNLETGVSTSDAPINLSTLDSNDSFILAQNGSQVTLANGNELNLEEGAKLTVGKDSQFINEGVLKANRASVTSNGDLITRLDTSTAELYFSDLSEIVPFISSDSAKRSTSQFFLSASVTDAHGISAAGNLTIDPAIQVRKYPFDISNGAVAISGTDYSNFDYKIFGNVEMSQDLNIRSAQELTIEQDSLLWIREGATPPGYTLKLDGALHNKGALWVDGRAYGDGKYVEYVDSELAGNGSIELNGATNVLGAITGDVKLQKTLTGGYKITIPENGNANIVANFKMNSQDELIVASGATLTVNSGVIFEVDGKVAIEPSKVDGGISYSEGTFTNNGTTTFGFGDETTPNVTEDFSNLGTMIGTFGVKTSPALNAMVKQHTQSTWHSNNTGSNGISPDCAILLVGVNKTFETSGNWDLSYRVSNEVYASKNITFTGGGIGNTTILLSNTTEPILKEVSALTGDAAISQLTAMVSDVSFESISFNGNASLSHVVNVVDGISSTDLSFNDCSFSNFTNEILRFDKSASGTDNVSGLEITNCEFNGKGIFANKLSNSTISDSTFMVSGGGSFGFYLHAQGLKNSSGSDLYISGIELTDNIYTATAKDVGIGVQVGGAEGAYVGEVNISGSSFTDFKTGVNVITPTVGTNKSSDQITLKDMLITTSTFTGCTTAIEAKNDDEKGLGVTPNALTPNNMLGTITYVKCTTKVDDPNNVFTFLVTSEQTLNEALSMSINNISMANSFSVSGSIHISDKNLTVPSGMTLTVNSSSTFRTSGTAQINVIGTIANSGTLNVGGTSFGGTGRVNTLTTGKVEGTKPIIMTTETVGGTSVRGTIDGIFFGDVTVQKNSSNGTFIIGVATDGYATANANYTLPVGSKLVGGTGTSEFEIVSGVTITVLGEVEEDYDYNSLYGNGILSFAPGSTLTRKGTPDEDNIAVPTTISTTEVIGDKGYLSFDRDITTTRLNRKGDNNTGYTYILASGKMTVDAESTTAPISYLVDGNNTLQISTGANITVPSEHTFIVENNGLVMANQTGYGTLIGVDRNSHASIHEGSSFGSISGPNDDADATTELTGAYIWAVNKWASETNTAGRDPDATAAPNGEGIGEDFAGNAETVYFTPAGGTSTTTGDLTIPAGRTLVIAANSDLVVGSTYTLFINGDVTFETDANIIGEDASAQMEVARGKSVVLGGITYGEGEYIWDDSIDMWVNKVEDQQSLTAALSNPTVKISRAIKSFSVTSNVTVSNGYDLKVDDGGITLTVNENVTVRVESGGEIIGLSDDGVLALKGLSYKSKLGVLTGGAIRLYTDTATSSGEFDLNSGATYAWNKVVESLAPAQVARWTQQAAFASDFIAHFNAGTEVIAVDNITFTNGTTVTENLYIPDGITLTVPNSGTLFVEATVADYIVTTGSTNEGKIVGTSTSSRLIVTGTGGTGYGKAPGTYVWAGTGDNADWMKIVTTWAEVEAEAAGEVIYFEPSASTVNITATSTEQVKATVTIANGKTVIINPGVTVTISGTGSITNGSGSSIRGADSSSELLIEDGGRYSGLSTNRNYAWHNNAWHRLVNLADIGSTVQANTAYVLDSSVAGNQTLPSYLSIAGTLVIQRGTTVTIPSGGTLEVTGVLTDGLVVGTDLTSRLILHNNQYTDQAGVSVGTGTHIWSGYFVGVQYGSIVWRKTTSLISTSGGIPTDSDTYFASSSPVVIVGSYVAYGASVASSTEQAQIYISATTGTELVINGSLTLQDGFDQVKVVNTTDKTKWDSISEVYLKNPTGLQIKGYDANSKLVAAGVTYSWDVTAKAWK